MNNISSFLFLTFFLHLNRFFGQDCIESDLDFVSLFSFECDPVGRVRILETPHFRVLVNSLLRKCAYPATEIMVHHRLGVVSQSPCMLWNVASGDRNVVDTMNSVDILEECLVCMQFLQLDVDTVRFYVLFDCSIFFSSSPFLSPSIYYHDSKVTVVAVGNCWRLDEPCLHLKYFLPLFSLFSMSKWTNVYALTVQCLSSFFDEIFAICDSMSCPMPDGGNERCEELILPLVLHIEQCSCKCIKSDIFSGESFYSVLLMHFPLHVSYTSVSLLLFSMARRRDPWGYGPEILSFEQRSYHAQSALSLFQSVDPKTQRTASLSVDFLLSLALAVLSLEFFLFLSIHM